MAENYVVNTARKVTQRSSAYSGKGMLTAELLAGFLIVLVRIIADFDPESGKGNVLHAQGTYGPLPICAGLILTFFALSLLAMGGGTRAKIAVIAGATVVIALALNSVTEFETIASSLGEIGQITVPAPSGTEATGASGNDTAASALGILSAGATGTASGSAGSATSTLGPVGTGGTAPNLGTLVQQAAGTTGTTGTGTNQPAQNNNAPPFGQGTIPGISGIVRSHTPSWLGKLL